MPLDFKLTDGARLDARHSKDAEQGTGAEIGRIGAKGFEFAPASPTAGEGRCYGTSSSQTS